MADNFIKERNQLLQNERELFCDNGNVILSEMELKVNDVLLKVKLEELENAYKDSTQFLPLRNFREAKPLIDNKSKVFKLIKSLPKGASLHTHMLAAVNVDYIIKNLTYRENLYGGYFNGIFKLKFFTPNNVETPWKLLKEYRNEDPNFDQWLQNILLLKTDYASAEDSWKDFKKIFSTLYDLVAYKPVFEDYVYQLLLELYEDNIIYTELRGTFTPLYDLTDGTTYDTKDFFDTFIGVVDKFKSSHPKFIGAKYIISIYRGVTYEELQSGLREIVYYKKLYPNFIAGFDFVGYEEEGKTLLDFQSELSEFGKDLQFFFHAGETNWFGHTDLNLVDAILLNSSRVGHAFALGKHPLLLNELKRRNIAIELSPISNQMLKLNQDPRNHPGATFLANNLNVVICNDDPSIWEATGLSYDWYITFMAMTWRSNGLEVLKKFALNSIEYSAMNAQEKQMAKKSWNILWEEYLDTVLLAPPK